MESVDNLNSFRRGDMSISFIIRTFAYLFIYWVVCYRNAHNYNVKQVYW